MTSNYTETHIIKSILTDTFIKSKEYIDIQLKKSTRCSDILVNCCDFLPNTCINTLKKLMQTNIVFNEIRLWHKNIIQVYEINDELDDDEMIYKKLLIDYVFTTLLLITFKIPILNHQEMIIKFRQKLATLSKNSIGFFRR